MITRFIEMVNRSQNRIIINRFGYSHSFVLRGGLYQPDCPVKTAIRKPREMDYLEWEPSSSEARQLEEFNEVLL
jgi:hypothetical protein